MDPMRVISVVVERLRFLSVNVTLCPIIAPTQGFYYRMRQTMTSWRTKPLQPSNAAHQKVIAGISVEDRGPLRRTDGCSWNNSFAVRRRRNAKVIAAEQHVARSFPLKQSHKLLRVLLSILKTQRRMLLSSEAPIKILIELVGRGTIPEIQHPMRLLCQNDQYLRAAVVATSGVRICEDLAGLVSMRRPSTILSKSIGCSPSLCRTHLCPLQGFSIELD